MPRFRVPDYIRTTFAVSDWRAFRLCGMDEVGRGAYAGPLVAAAVVLPQRFRHLVAPRQPSCSPRRQRELVGAVLRKRAVAWAWPKVSVDDIKRAGSRVGRTSRSFGGWSTPSTPTGTAATATCASPCRVASLTGRGRPQGAGGVGSSIIAKVHRDALMTRMHDEAPHYNWASNKGYGAPEHRAAIREHGPHPAHRRSSSRQFCRRSRPDRNRPLSSP